MNSLPKLVEGLIPQEPVQDRVLFVQGLDQPGAVRMPIDAEPRLHRQRRGIDDGVRDRAGLTQEIALQLAL